MVVAMAASWAHAAPKAALVIGNGAYRSVTPLSNPANDASDMAASLGRLGYRVTLVRDGDLQAMNDGVRAFLRDADHADSVVVFYSGHGVQVKGRNYLIPVSAKIADELDLDTQALSLDKLLDLVDGASAKVKIVILDSCRDNPLAHALVRGAGTRGLARVDLDASEAKGTLIAFSTAPGSVAQDGTGRNSPFTQALLAHMGTPGLDIRQMFGQVRADVDQATQGAQTPWVNEAIIGSFAIAGSVADPQPVKVLQPAQDNAAAVQPTRKEASAVPLPDVPAEAPRNVQPGFILPESGDRQLGWDEVAALSPVQLRVARNEIFARRGRFMKDAQLRAYFSQFYWYRPFTWNVTLNPVEKANLALIQRAESAP
ncbi:caspase family protein [Labrys monachus]|uniref:Caspase-like protein n=1 Tax=Labrys monachus TaxID=217067 RepID=A0ABU0FKL6_9HYPH|nr:caspase family protein [Labrys monachus]MDQ0395153.1 putative caspase-like protein [Labrys monachus]